MSNTLILPTRVPLDPSRHSEKIGALGTFLRQNIIGQDEVLTAMLGTYEMFLSGLTSTSQPVGNFFFLGPTGTGKTASCEALAKGLKHIGAPGADGTVVQVDCGEYQHSHEISKLLGSPAGYLGHRETPPILKQSALNTTNGGVSLIVFDEIEKASSALAALLLGILDKGQLTLGDNTKTSFRNCFIFFTSNIAADKMQTLFHDGMGFTNTTSTDSISKMGLAGLKKKFSPEFFNRLDRNNIVTFKPLSTESIEKILELELARVQEKVKISGGSSLTFTPAAKRLLIKEGFEPQYGARPLLQVVKSLILTPLAAIIASGQVGASAAIEVGEAGGKLTFDAWVTK